MDKNAHGRKRDADRMQPALERSSTRSRRAYKMRQSQFAGMGGIQFRIDKPSVNVGINFKANQTGCRATSPAKKKPTLIDSGVCLLCDAATILINQSAGQEPVD